MTLNRDGAPTRFPNGVNNGSPETFPGQLVVPDRTYAHEHFDDFNYFDSFEWSTNRYSQGAGQIGIATGEDNGVLFVLNAGADFDSQGVNLAQFVYQYDTDSLPIWYKCRFKLNETVQSRFATGHWDGVNPPAASNNCCGFQKDDGSATLKFRSARPIFGQNVSVDLFDLEDDTYVTVAFFYDGNEKFQIYRNDQLIEVVNTPWTPNNPVSPIAYIQNGEASAKSMSIDYMYSGKERTLGG